MSYHLDLVIEILRQAGFGASKENGLVLVELNRPIGAHEVELALEEYELVSEGLVTVTARSQYGDVLVEVIE